MSGVAWVLNLDSDIELARRGGSTYTPTNAVKSAMARSQSLLTKSLLGKDDIVVLDDGEVDATGYIGRAWCPTTRAIEILRRAGASIPAHPSQDVLRTVNSRAFSAALGQTLPGASFVTSLDDARTLLGQPPPLLGFRDWRVKRAFGMAGRGQRTIDPQRVTAGDLAAVAAAIRDEGGVQIEPNIPSIEGELGLHGMLSLEGEWKEGTLVEQRCDAHGQWLETLVAVDKTRERAMRDELANVARALHAAGYFGPFGVDAFVYRNPSTRELHLQPRSEINARYSMGFAIGFQGVTLDGGQAR